MHVGRDARRKVPRLFLRVPAERRLEKIAVMLDQVRVAVFSGTDHILHLGIHLRHDLPTRITAGFHVVNHAVAALDAKFKAVRQERIPRRRIKPFVARPSLKWRHGPAHGVMAKGRGLFLVA